MRTKYAVRRSTHSQGARKVREDARMRESAQGAQRCAVVRNAKMQCVKVRKDA